MEYVSTSSSVSIHNTIEMQNWEKRKGISKNFDPTRRGYTYNREHKQQLPTDTQPPPQQSPHRRHRSRSRSPPRRRDYSYNSESTYGRDKRFLEEHGDTGSHNTERFAHQGGHQFREFDSGEVNHLPRSSSAHCGNRTEQRYRYSNYKHALSYSHTPTNHYNYRATSPRREHRPRSPSLPRHDRQSSTFEGRMERSRAPLIRDNHRQHSAEYMKQRVTHSGEQDHGGGGWERVPERRRDDRDNYHARAYHNKSSDTREPAIPQVAFVPPNHLNKQFKPFMLLLVGIPGSGKSTFASCLVQGKPWMYVRVNQDQLGNRRACEDLARKALADGKCPIIDRCNFDPSQRKHFLDIAAQTGVDVDAVIFQYPMAVCVARCQSRTHHETVAPHAAQGVVQRMVKQFFPPLPNRINAEKFRTLITVTDLPSFDDVMMEFLNKNFE